MPMQLDGLVGVYWAIEVGRLDRDRIVFRASGPVNRILTQDEAPTTEKSGM
jgi:hypothetical protein